MSDAAERKRFVVELTVRALDRYEDGQIGLARLVADVEGGIDALTDVADRGWVEDMRSAWSGLEIVYAMALDEGRAALDDDERGDIATAIAELRALLSADVSS